MVIPPSDESQKVLQPSLLPVPDHSVPDNIASLPKASPRYQHCVSDGVRDGAGIAVINSVTVTNLIITTSLHLTLLPYSIFKIEALILGPVRFDQRGCPALLKAATSSHEVCAAAVGWSPGDVIASPHIQSDSRLPGACVGAPLDAADIIYQIPSHPNKNTKYFRLLLSKVRELKRDLTQNDEY